MPNLRLGWTLSPRQQLWAAWSESKRLPSFYEQSLSIPPVLIPNGAPPPFPGLFFTFLPNPDLTGEALRASELGYRLQVSSAWSLDLAAYRMDYENLAIFAPGAPVFDPALGGLRLDITPRNLGVARNQGIETKLRYAPAGGFRASLAYAYADNNLDVPASTLAVSTTLGQRDPWAKHSASLQLGYSPGDAFAVDALFHYRSDIPVVRDVATLREEAIDASLRLDLRFSWRPRADFEVALTGMDLGDGERVRFLGEPIIAPVGVGPRWQIELRHDF